MTFSGTAPDYVKNLRHIPTENDEQFFFSFQERTPAHRQFEARIESMTNAMVACEPVFNATQCQDR